ncbi:PREDICTED: uncharacterized protein LOC104704325 [Camelina sativa]|uniref:Uncharacterized protein LOC104704325 n=1 Tax=Camelina sativa TaxID=90675 RepID=A0ABM0T072_CAMSA|nr:PREDICTED: uncharacterized protein LOC104704325 [Camelina sativa]
MAAESIAITDTHTLLSVNMTNVTRLTTTNFLMWSRQVHALLNDYSLAGYLDGSTTVPSLTITTEDGVVKPNPDYLLWQRQDQLIYSALLGAISVSIQPILSTTVTSAQIWSKLSLIYANPSRGHVQQIRQQIRQWKKGSKTIDDYVQGFMTRFDQLALLGKPIDIEDQVDYIIDGLPEDYKQVIDQIQARDVSPSLTEVHEKLLNYEVKLQALTSSSTDLPISANVVRHHAPSNNGNRSTYPRGQSRHSYYRGSSSHHNNSHPRQDASSSRGYQGKCQICGIFGHSARRCPKLGTIIPSMPRANFAGVPLSANPWLLDSGSTHHIVSDLANLSLHQPYNGGEEVVVGNGAGLPITHTGSTLLPSSTKNP